MTSIKIGKLITNYLRMVNIAINGFRGDYSYFKKEIALKNYPRVFAMELTNYCNLKCIMCPLPNQMKRDRGFMNFSLFKKVIDEISPYTYSVWLHVFGEPLLHPNLINMITYCNEKGVKPCLSTNGLLLTHEMSEKLLSSNLYEIVFSIDAASKEIYDKIRKNSNFEVVVANITFFLKMRHIKASIIRTSVQLIKMNNNTKEIDKFISMWKKYDIDITIKNFDTWAGTLSDVESLSKDLIGNNKKQRYPCKILWQYLIILWDGNVVLCERDYDAKVSVGNIANDSLFNIWNGNKMIELRRQQIQSNFSNGLCNRCSEYEGHSTTIKYLFEQTYINKIWFALLPNKWKLYISSLLDMDNQFLEKIKKNIGFYEFKYKEKRD